MYISNNSIKHQSFVYTQLNDQTVLFQAIQFIISHLFTFSLNIKQFYLTHRYDPISGYYSDQSGPGSNGNKGVLRILQNSSITGASKSDCLVSYPGHLLRGSYPSVGTWSAYSAAPAD